MSLRDKDPERRERQCTIWFGILAGDGQGGCFGGGWSNCLLLSSPKVDRPSWSGWAVRKQTVTGDATGNTLLWPSEMEHELDESTHSCRSMDAGWMTTER